MSCYRSKKFRFISNIRQLLIIGLLLWPFQATGHFNELLTILQKLIFGSKCLGQVARYFPIVWDLRNTISVKDFHILKLQRNKSVWFMDFTENFHKSTLVVQL